MQITVFGANGKVGRLVVAELLRRGHQPIAFVHSESRLSSHDNLRIVQGDIYDANIVAQAVNGSQAVISALGSWGTPKKDILTVGMRHIIPAMQANGISRIVSLTGAGANALGDKLNLADKGLHSLMNLFAGKILTDGEQHINILQQSQLDWTVIRSPIMVEIGKPDYYRLTDKRPSSLATINRSAVVMAMVDLTESNKYVQKAPFIIP